jgi:predicted RNase H-like nuclease (RuvC/YqgF family)
MDSHQLYELLFKNFLITTREHELSPEQVHHIDCFRRDIEKQVRADSPTQEASSRIVRLQDRIYDLEEEVDELKEKLAELGEE